MYVFVPDVVIFHRQVFGLNVVAAAVTRAPGLFTFAALCDKKLPL
jgi:hypothetical protein